MDGAKVVNAANVSARTKICIRHSAHRQRRMVAENERALVVIISPVERDGSVLPCRIFELVLPGIILNIKFKVNHVHCVICVEDAGAVLR